VSTVFKRGGGREPGAVSLHEKREGKGDVRQVTFSKKKVICLLYRERGECRRAIPRNKRGGNYFNREAEEKALLAVGKGGHGLEKKGRTPPWQG